MHLSLKKHIIRLFLCAIVIFCSVGFSGCSDGQKNIEVSQKTNDPILPQESVEAVPKSSEPVLSHESSNTNQNFSKPVLPAGFFETFPFCADEYSVISWFAKNSDYKDFEVVGGGPFGEAEYETSVNAFYYGNVDWGICAVNCKSRAISESVSLLGLTGFMAIFNPLEDYSEQEYRDIYNCAIEELTELYGAPTSTQTDLYACPIDTSDGKTVAHFESESIKIVVIGEKDWVEIQAAGRG